MGIHKISCHFLFSLKKLFLSLRRLRKSRNIVSTFIYGTIVNTDYFTDRVDEVKFNVITNFSSQ